MEPTVESAYSAVRQAFEAWIELTAFDTAQAAMKEHTDAADEAPRDAENES
jgi:hypothetical protein